MLFCERKGDLINIYFSHFAQICVSGNPPLTFNFIFVLREILKWKFTFTALYGAHDEMSSSCLYKFRVYFLYILKFLSFMIYSKLY